MREEGLRFVLTRDRGKNPFLPGCKEHDLWRANNQKELLKLQDKREKLFLNAQRLALDPDVAVRELAKFYLWFFSRP